MIITKATTKDIDDILIIIEEAKRFLKENNVDQWQDGYPNKDTLLEDIKNKNLYVVEDGGMIVAVFALVEYDSNYDLIYDGNWNKDSAYIALHRIAVSSKGKGISKIIFDYVKQRYDYIRIDTHKDNKIMQKCLAKNGFKYCGTIILNRDKSKRLAYDYINDQK